MINNLRELNDKVNSLVNYVVKTACEHTTSGQYYVSVVDACKTAEMSYEDFLQYKDFVFEELSAREELLDFEFNEKDFEFDVNCGLNYCPGYQWCDGDEEVFDCSFEEWLKRPTLPISQPLSMSQMAEIGAGAISFIAYKEEKTLEDVVKNSLCFDVDIAQAVIDTVEMRERKVIAKLDATILENDEKLKSRDTFEGALIYHHTSSFSESVKYTDFDKFLKDYADALDSMGPNGCTAKPYSDDLKVRYEIAKTAYDYFGEAIEPFEQWKAKIEAAEKPALDKVIKSCEEVSKNSAVDKNTALDRDDR